MFQCIQKGQIQQCNDSIYTIFQATIHYFDGGIYYLENASTFPSLGAKLACCWVLHTVHHCIARKKVCYWKQRDKNEAWDEKRVIHPGNAGKQEDVDSFFLMTPLFKKKSKKNTFFEHCAFHVQLNLQSCGAKVYFVKLNKWTVNSTFLYIFFFLLFFLVVAYSLFLS